MIKDIYTRDSESYKYNDNTLEINDYLSQLIIKIENTLFTTKGEVLGDNNFGANLNELIFSLVLNESVIESKINNQIHTYCINGNAKFNVYSKVSFYSLPERNGAIVDIFVNENKVLGAIF